MVLFISFVSAFIFGIGLFISGMTQPEKVIGFLDIFGDWDPSLALVMVGAISTHFLFIHFVQRKMRQPLLNSAFHLPLLRHVDAKLVSGAAIFGIGWGLAGICPGPAFVRLAEGKPSIIVFIVGMVGGIYICVSTKSFLGRLKKNSQIHQVNHEPSTL